MYLIDLTVNDTSMNVSFSKKLSKIELNRLPFGDVCCLIPAPFLQSIVSSHLNLPPSNQQIMDRTIIFDNLFYSDVRRNIEEKIYFNFC